MTLAADVDGATAFEFTPLRRRADPEGLLSIYVVLIISGARLSYPGKKDKKISYMLSRQRYAEWLPTALNVTGCSAFSKKRGTGAGHGSRGHG